jgi:hypothetical protein
MELLELVPSIAVRIGQVGEIGAGVEQLGQHQFSPAD